MSDKDHIEKLIEQHVAQISEHVTAVQILVTVQNGMETTRYTNGAGCWYSRMGAMREMIIRDNAVIAARASQDTVAKADEEDD